jgi:acetyl esterase
LTADPAIAALLQRTRRAQPACEAGLAAARARPTLAGALFRESRFDGAVRDLRFPGDAGAPLKARLFLPPGACDCIVFFHGGGWVLGSVEQYHHLTATLAQRTGAAVFSVDYRLAPEHPFPVPVRDAEAALAFVSRHGDELLGRLLRRLVAMGDSAGAALATVAARRHNQARHQRPVDLQVLAYPVCDADFGTASYRSHGEGYLLTRQDMRWFWDQYAPNPLQRLDGDCAPLRCRDLAGSPPALVATAGLDPLQAEGQAYAGCLAAAGVRTQHIRFEGLPHGFLALATRSRTAGEALEVLLAELGSFFTVS